MTVKDNMKGKKASPRNDAKTKKDKVGKTKKETHEGAVSASVASYVNYQLSQLDRGMIVASSSWPNRK